ncbi:MAG TPA: hypothetical protein VLM37_12370 [Fibrobacteraceae bacterium]|nr:hypothetical protein [Fibrobacteraceae bacterium]
MAVAKEKIGEILLREGIIDQEQLAHALEEHRRTGILMGKILVGLGMVSEELLLATVAKQTKARDSRKIGELLIERGLVTQEQMETALEMSKRTGQKLGTVLVKKGFVDEHALLDILSMRLEIPQVRLTNYGFSPEAMRLMTEEVCRQFRAVPMEIHGQKVKIAMADPSDMKASDVLRFKIGMDLEPVMATEKEILDAIDRVYHKREPLSPSAKDGVYQALEKMYEAQKNLVALEEKALMQQRTILASVQDLLVVVRKSK